MFRRSWFGSCPQQPRRSATRSSPSDLDMMNQNGDCCKVGVPQRGYRGIYVYIYIYLHMYISLSLSLSLSLSGSLDTYIYIERERER